MFADVQVRTVGHSDYLCRHEDTKNHLCLIIFHHYNIHMYKALLAVWCRQLTREHTYYHIIISPYCNC
jgi:hypothetical protein